MIRLYFTNIIYTIEKFESKLMTNVKKKCKSTNNDQPRNIIFIIFGSFGFF